VRKVRFLAATAILLTAPLAAQSPMFDTTRLSQHVQTLGSDAYEGRGPATNAETKTIAYLVQQFTEAGLEPGGDATPAGRFWTQRVPLLRSEWVGAPQVSVNIAGEATPLTQGDQIAARAPTNGEKTVSIDGAELVFVGYGVKAPERGWDDFKGADLKGKIIVVLVNDPDFEGGEGNFGGKAMTYYGRWTYKYEEGARQGAKGVLVIHETEPASYGWATVKNSNTNTMFDIVRQDPASQHPPLEGWIQRDLAAQLFAASGTSFEAVKAAAKRKDFKPVPLKATLDVNGQAKTEVITSHNVVGVLPGKSRPDETIIYTAHWDHLGIGQPDANGDRIYNGALDNATGISHIIEQARAFAKEPRTDRSIVFLAVTAEEKGLLGSEYYARNPLYPLGKTVAVLNTDSMGVFGPARDFSIAGTAKLELLDLLVAEGQREGRTFTPDRHPESGGFYRSDHFSFAKVGVPAISYKSGSDLVDGGLVRGEAISKEYTANRYHQPDDEWSPDWRFDGIAADATLLHAVGRDLANGNAWPNWSQDSEFRATRDSTAGERGTPATAKPGERG